MKKESCLVLVFLLVLNLFGSTVVSENITEQKEKNGVFPSVFSWRDVNGTDFTTSVKNQEGLKTDAVFSLISCLETMVQYKIGYPFYCDLSEAHLFFNSNGSSFDGVNISRCADYLVEFGVPDEGCFAYPERVYDSDIYYNMSSWQDRSVRINDWEWIENNVTSIKHAIYNNGPVSVLLNTSFGFFNHKKDFFKPRKLVSGVQWVSIVGFDDGEECWICKNSWGSKWGDYGWFKIPYDSGLITDGKYLNNSFISKNSTGVISLVGVNGNLNPDVPIVKIYQPARGLTYRNIFGNIIYRDESWFLNLPFLTETLLCNFYQKIFGKIFPNKVIDPRIPRVKKSFLVEICGVRFSANASVFVDDELVHNFTKTTFLATLSIESKGIHTMRVEAENKEGLKSVDIREFLVL